jgi:hypothetical protein
MNDDSARPGAEDGATAERKVWSTPILTAVAADDAAASAENTGPEYGIYS